MHSLFGSESGSMKGQVEFVVVIGLIIVGAVFVILTTQNVIPTVPPAPSDIRLEQELVTESMELVAKGAAENTLRVVEAHGGYLTPGLLENGQVVDFTVFLDNGVPIAQACSSASGVPSNQLVRNLFEISMERYIRDNVDSLITASDKAVITDLNSLNVNANILSDRIQVAVTLPTSVEGYSMQQPYPIIEIPTKLGRILEFERDFTTEAANSRFFETFTIHSIQFSRHLYHDGVLTECGKGLDVSGSEIDSGLERAVRASIRPALWTSMVDQSSGPLSDLPKIYAVPDVNGKVYNDIEVRFDLPDGFSISGSDDIKVDNDDVALFVPGLAPPLETTDVCIQTYSNAYGVSYPVIVSAFDDMTKQWFRFALIVHVSTESGPSGIDAEGLVGESLGSFDQSINDAGLGSDSFAAALDQAAADEGTTLDDAARQDALDTLAANTEDLRSAIAGSVDTVSGTQGVSMGFGNCVFG